MPVATPMMITTPIAMKNDMRATPPRSARISDHAFTPRGSGQWKSPSRLSGPTWAQLDYLGCREPAQGVRDRLVTVVGGVLVAHRRMRSRVPDPAHQLSQCGSGGGSERGPGVPQVVEAQIRPPIGGASGMERLV